MRTLKQIDQDIQVLEQQLKSVTGTSTEVYTRIVGYHRAVDNWNNGKKEEFKKRVTFSFNSQEVGSKLSTIEAMQKNTAEEKNEASEELDLSNVAFYKLFTSQFCRNCPPVKAFMEELPVVGEEIDVSTDLGISVSRKYEVMSTPTVILFDNNDKVIDRAYTVNDLRRIFAKKEAMVS